MGTVNYKVYYNAVSTEYGNYLYAIGWTSCSVEKVYFKNDDSSNTYTLVIEPGEISIQVISPFAIMTKIESESTPKSINVADKYGNWQVQLDGIQEKKFIDMGLWVKSGKL